MKTGLCTSLRVCSRLRGEGAAEIARAGLSGCCLCAKGARTQAANSRNRQKGRGPPVIPEARDRLDAALSRVLSGGWFALETLTGAQRTFQPWRPFLWAPRCRGARAVHPPPEFPHARTGHLPFGSEGCVTLHALGFAMRQPSRTGRCALTAPFHPCLIHLAAAIGGSISVALSLDRAPNCSVPVRVGVTHQRVLPCSDFPQKPDHPASAAALPRRRSIVSPRADRKFGLPRVFGYRVR